MIQRIDLNVGEPGTGKTYTITHLAKEIIQRGDTLHIVSPTMSARDNIRKTYDQFFEKGMITRDEKVTLRSSTQVLHGYDKAKSTNIIIEEAGMIELTILHGILHVAQIVPDVNVYIFGDIKQLMPVQGTSVLENIMTINNLNQDTPFWEWVNTCAYDDIEDQTLKAPIDWQVDVPINLNIMRKNYRLQSHGFTGYNDEYYDHVISGTIEAEDYTSQLKYALDHNYLIVAPTKNRGKEINDALSQVFKGQQVDQVAPFIIINNDTYLNPFNTRYNVLKDKFSFMKQIKKADVVDPVAFTAFITTHQAQGVTVDNVAYYMGNKAIWKTHKAHYNNNQLYTALTRAKYNVMLLGLKQSFDEMRTIYPQNASDNLTSIQKKVAMNNLVADLQQAQQHPNPDDLYDMYLSYMGNKELLSPYELEMMNYYGIEQEVYSQRYVVSQVNKRVKTIRGFSTLSKWLSDNKNVRGGKVKPWLNSLNADETAQLKSDLTSRMIKQAEFKAKYGYTKEQVRKAFI